MPIQVENSVVTVVTSVTLTTKNGFGPVTVEPYEALPGDHGPAVLFEPKGHYYQAADVRVFATALLQICDQVEGK